MWVALSDCRKNISIQTCLGISRWYLLSKSVVFLTASSAILLSTDCDKSFQAIRLIFPMMLCITSSDITFHRGHSEGWNLCGGSVASLIISRNQIYLDQKGVIMISSSSHFSIFLKTSCIMFGVEKFILGLLTILPSVHLLLRLSCLRGLIWSHRTLQMPFYLQINPAMEFLLSEQSLAGVSP